MGKKTKIVVIKLKDILFYATVAALCIIVLLLLVILFTPESTTTNATISVQGETVNPAIEMTAGLFATNTVTFL